FPGRFTVSFSRYQGQQLLTGYERADYRQPEKILPVKDHLISQPGKPALQHFIHRCILSR
ncbi:hypothetical protein, partial [Escherichia coli]|uniref:hypothetical protein n=1 Tax=Escherichia coli TaxID=562 RepID=UPI001BA6D3A8